MPPDVLRVERSFTGVVNPNLTGRKIGPETRADAMRSIFLKGAGLRDK